MYTFLFRSLPGPTWLRWLIVLVVLVALFFLLMEVVFPWVAPLLPYNDVSIDGA